MHVVTAEYHKKVKKIELKFEKVKVLARNKKLTDPSTFPLKLQGNNTSWKLSLGFDQHQKVFVLSINDKPFLMLPYQAEAIPPGPQNILSGTILFNGEEVHDSWAKY